jgi:hypothetical protein
MTTYYTRTDNQSICIDCCFYKSYTRCPFKVLNSLSCEHYTYKDK